MVAGVPALIFVQRARLQNQQNMIRTGAVIAAPVPAVHVELHGLQSEACPTCEIVEAGALRESIIKLRARSPKKLNKTLHRDNPAREQGAERS